MKTSRTQFFYLCALGVWGLWGFAFFNGMFDRLEAIMRTRLLPDGRPLRDVYTGSAFVDEQLTLVVAFYDVLSTVYSSGPRLLFFDINYVVACTNLWVLIESRRRGVRNWFLKYPAWAMMLWNFNGAAIMQPPYFYLLCRSQARLRDPTIPVNESRAIFLTTFAILLSPLLIFAPAWAGSTTWDHHGYLAMFHYSPVIVTALFLVAARVLPAGAPEPAAGSRKAYSASREPKRWIVASLALAGTVAAAAHIYVVVGALVTRDPDASLTRLFMPARGTADPIGALPASLAGLEPEHAALLENFHLFSQYDWYVVSLSCVVFAHLLLSRREGEKAAAAAFTRLEARELAYLSAATVLLGPGAAGSFALAIREARI